MLDFINYYYNLYPIDIDEQNKKYIFYVDDEKYYLVQYDGEINELEALIELNREMINNGSLIHEIIFNKFNKSLSTYNGINYLLLKVFVNDTKKVEIEDILFMLNEGNININRKNILNRFNWPKLWEVKIDYFEYQMLHVIKKYPVLYNIIDYYIGLGENAIQYFKMISPNYFGIADIGVCHNRIDANSSLFDLYNPLNLVIDYKVRDISEYLKSYFFYNINNIYNIINKIFARFSFDKLNLSLLISRLLFPSYFFDMFESIVYCNKNENSIMNITKKSSLYEDFIKNLIKKCNLQTIGWLQINQY